MASCTMYGAYYRCASGLGYEKYERDGTRALTRSNEYYTLFVAIWVVVFYPFCSVTLFFVRLPSRRKRAGRPQAGMRLYKQVEKW